MYLYVVYGGASNMIYTVCSFQYSWEMQYFQKLCFTSIWKAAQIRRCPVDTVHQVCEREQKTWEGSSRRRYIKQFRWEESHWVSYKTFSGLIDFRPDIKILDPPHKSGICENNIHSMRMLGESSHQNYSQNHRFYISVYDDLSDCSLTPTFHLKSWICSSRKTWPFLGLQGTNIT